MSDIEKSESLRTAEGGNRTRTLSRGPDFESDMGLRNGNSRASFDDVTRDSADLADGGWRNQNGLTPAQNGHTPSHRSCVDAGMVAGLRPRGFATDALILASGLSCMVGLVAGVAFAAVMRARDGEPQRCVEMDAVGIVVPR